MKKNCGVIVVVCSLFVFSGCSWMIEPAVVPNAGMENARTFEPADYEHIAVGEDDKCKTCFKYNVQGECKERVCLPLFANDFFGGTATVLGEINGRSYPFVFDTGWPHGLCVQDVHVRENDLPVYFFDKEKRNSSSGLALVEDLRVGGLKFREFPCHLLRNYMQVHFMGVPVKRSKHVFVSLDVIKKFQYFRFDRIDDKLAFDANEAFTVEDESEWIKFRFEIADNKLFLKIPLEGVELVWFLDTGAYSQLTIDESSFDKFLKVRRDLEDNRQYREEAFMPYAGGMKEGKAIDVDELMFGEHGIEDVRVVYEAADVFGELPYQGVIGFGLFEDTVMVLDFERSLMWVKKAGKFAV